MSDDLLACLSDELSRRRIQHLYRERVSREGPQAPRIRVDGSEYLAFCSNDYLGLAGHPELIRSLQGAAEKHGVGAGASHLISGHSVCHRALEEELADFVGAQRALLFSTGYMANLGVLSALLGRDDLVLEDRLNHASLIDGALLSRADLRRYSHLDSRQLARRIGQARPGHWLVASDGVFSMDGDLAPVPELLDLAVKRQGLLLIDDAHALGVIGEQGRGSFEHWQCQITAPAILIGTLGKALGTFGAFVAGDDDLIEYLIQTARTYIYTTALPPAVAEATRTSLQLIRREPERRQRLHNNVAYFRDQASSMGLALAESTTPIQPIMIGETAAAVQVSDRLRQQGILVPAIRPPTVPEGTSRLRVTLSATHERAHVDELLQALDRCLDPQGRCAP